MRVQDPVRLDDRSEPQPDLAVVKARDDFYRDAHPGPADILLVIEVADTSAEIDRVEKVPLHSRSGIPEVWVVDLSAQQIEVYRTPTSGGYLEHEAVRHGESLRPRAILQVEIRAGDVIV